MQADFELIYHYAKTQDNQALEDLLLKNKGKIDPVGLDENGCYWPSPICRLAAEGKAEAVIFLKSFYQRKDFETDIQIGQGFAADEKKIKAIIANSGQHHPSLTISNLLKGLALANRLDDIKKAFDQLKAERSHYFSEAENGSLYLLDQHLGFNGGDLTKLTNICLSLSPANSPLAKQIKVSLHKGYNDGLIFGDQPLSDEIWYFIDTQRMVKLLSHLGRCVQIENFWLNRPFSTSDWMLKKSLKGSWVGITERNFLYFAAQASNPNFRKMICTYFASYKRSLAITNEVGRNPKRLTALAMGLHRAMQAGKTYDEALTLFDISSIAHVATQETADKLTRLKGQSLSNSINEQELTDLGTSQSSDLDVHVRFYHSFSSLMDQLRQFESNYKKKKNKQTPVNPATIELSERIATKIEEITDTLLLNTAITDTDVTHLEAINESVGLLNDLLSNKNQGNNLGSNSASNPQIQQLKEIAKKLHDTGDSTGYQALGICLMSLGVLLTPLIVGVPLFKLGYGFFEKGQPLETNLNDAIDAITANVPPKPSY